ncbi:MAG: hypothetical protein CMO80_22200 [Verrucomicrobiales bacterium]|nr:hypothetical protein [Verrucomicrobiales bacterium]|tara:strand:+ start:31988 stop:33448 length:1461 start_codon:yes stop_codon:yes gene_type:complete
MTIEVKNKTQALLTNAHPLYTAMQEVWELGRDSFGGEPAIKDKRDKYLPPTSGMRNDGFGKVANSEGDLAYEAYLIRSYYPDTYAEAVESAVGVMHRKPAQIELPKRMESLFDVATNDGEDLQLLLRRINAMQLTEGRLGLLGTLEEVDGKVMPKLIVHNALSVFNWDDTLNQDAGQNLRFIEINESDYKMSPSYSWEWKNKVRVLAIINAEGQIVGFDEEGELESGVYGYAILDDTQAELQSATFEEITYKGTELDRIPFTFINSKDLSCVPDKPPLDGLARLALAIYRGEADYRQNLFMQGQDTLVRIGFVEGTDENGDKIRTGAGAAIDVPVNGDAKYIGVDGSGLSEQRESLKSDYEKADKKTAKLMANGSNESGEALKVRVAAQTATLPQIAETGAAGLEKVLRDLAVWLGEDPDKVVVKPNLEFAGTNGDGQTLTQIVQAKTLGAPISEQSIHAWMAEQGFTNLSYEEEMAYISGEEPKV